MSIEQVVNVSISRETATIDQAGFGRALILGPNLPGADLVKLYSNLEAVAEDFETTDAEYIAASKLFGQALKPVDVLIGQRAAAVAQVDTVTIGTLEDADYTVTINGTAFTHNPSGVPADKSTVAAALLALVNAGSLPVTASLGGTNPNETLVLTADNAGQPFTTTVTTNMTLAHTTANVGVDTDLNGIVASGDLGDSWYALILCSRLDYEILTAAAWIESRRKIFIACSSAAAILTSSTTDIASQLQDAAYARTAILYSGDQAHYPEAAWLGKGLTAEPGSLTYSLKTLAGITYDELTATEIAYAKAKGANYYIQIGGVNITQNGNVAEGEWIDVIVGIDWIQARASENIFATLVANPKIPFTDAGIDQIVNPLRQILQQAVNRSILASFTITVPEASSFTAVQKQSRVLTGIIFEGVLAGAVHAVTITGKVHV